MRDIVGCQKRVEVNLRVLTNFQQICIIHILTSINCIAGWPGQQKKTANGAQQIAHLLVVGKMRCVINKDFKNGSYCCQVRYINN